MVYANKKIAVIFFVFLAASIFPAKSKIKFKADSMSGSVAENKNTTNLIGNAVVKVDTMEIKADKIELYGKDYRYLKAIGSVKGEDKDKGFSFISDSMQYDRTLEMALFFGKIELNDTKNDVKISAEHVEYNQKAETMLMQFNVNIVQKDINCQATFALYNRDSSKLSLTGRPIVKKNKDEFKAAKISVNLNTEDISLEGKVSGAVTEEKEAKESVNKKTAKEEKDGEDSLEDEDDESETKNLRGKTFPNDTGKKTDSSEEKSDEKTEDDKDDKKEKNKKDDKQKPENQQNEQSDNDNDRNKNYEESS